MARPTEYRQEFCERVIEAGKAGKSVAWMAAELDVSKRTLLNWAEAHPEFLHALETAKAHAQRWWEDAGQTGMVTPGFGASVWSRSMAARFPDDWRESKGVELTGKDGGPVKTDNHWTIEVVEANAKADAS